MNPSACSPNTSSPTSGSWAGRRYIAPGFTAAPCWRRTRASSIPSYWRFDTFAEARINKNWKVKLFVNNIFDKRYYDALYQSAAPFVLEAPGRAAYLVLSARY
jgi:outer membrane receptor protein involved in Fe transport